MFPQMCFIIKASYKFICDDVMPLCKTAQKKEWYKSFFVLVFSLWHKDKMSAVSFIRLSVPCYIQISA